MSDLVVTDGSVGSGCCPCRHFPLSFRESKNIDCKMLARRVLIVCLIKCLLIATIIPLSLQNSDYPPQEHDYHGAIEGYIEDDSNQPEVQYNNPEGSEVGTAGNGDDAPPPPENDVADDDQTESPGAGDSISDPDIEVVQHIDEPTAETTENPETTENDADNADATESPESDAGDTTDEAATEASTTTADNGDDGDGDGDDGDDDKGSDDNGKTASCSSSNEEYKESLTDLTGKIEQLIGVIDNINGSIQRMESLVQSTIIDERLYKCISAINNGNQSQALKYWKQILRYQTDPSKKSSIFKQIIKDSYLGKEENLLSIIKFIDASHEYYGYETLFEQLKSFNQLYHNKAIFTLANFIMKGCSRSSELFKLMPPAVQAINSKLFTLQSKFNRGYLYYAKRCVARHYYYCLDVLTKKIQTAEMEYLDPEEKGRYHWKLNATDETVSKFFILNQDKYWSYRLQDVNNSPRFKMVETGNTFEIELAQFMLELSTDDEIAIQVRDTDIYLEGEEFKFDNTSEVLLHSFHKSDALSTNRMNWIVQSVDDDITDGDLADNENCKIVSNGNGNGNGGR